MQIINNIIPIYYKNYYKVYLNCLVCSESIVYGHFKIILSKGETIKIEDNL